MADVREYYDEFSGSVLLNDFRRPNERQDSIKALCDRFLTPGARVLEIGCGVGILTRHLCRRAGHVFSVDISGNNVRIAKAYQGTANVEFAVLDVVEQAEELKARGPFDAVLLADVIEHIPMSSHAPLFSSIEDVLTDDGIVILTYPTPEYQEFLKAEEPEGLQVIDETVALVDILSATTLKPVYFTYRKVWNDNEFADLVLARNPVFARVTVPMSAIRKLGFWTRKYVWRARHAAFVRKMREELRRPGCDS